MTNIFTLTIPNGQSESNVVDFTGYKHFQIYMPSAWTTAALTFLTAPDDINTFQKLTDDAGTEISLSSAVAIASVSIMIDDLCVPFAALTLCKFRSGTAATPVNQGAARTIKVIAKS